MDIKNKTNYISLKPLIYNATIDKLYKNQGNNEKYNYRKFSFNNIQMTHKEIFLPYFFSQFKMTLFFIAYKNNIKKKLLILTVGQLKTH